MKRIIATLQEPEIAAKMVIRRTDETGYYEIITRYDNGDSSTEWKRVGEPRLRQLMSLHFGLPQTQIDSLLTA